MVLGFLMLLPSKFIFCTIYLLIHLSLLVSYRAHGRVGWGDMEDESDNNLQVLVYNSNYCSMGVGIFTSVVCLTDFRNNVFVHLLVESMFVSSFSLSVFHVVS